MAASTVAKIFAGAAGAVVTLLAAGAVSTFLQKKLALDLAAEQKQHAHELALKEAQAVVHEAKTDRKARATQSYRDEIALLGLQKDPLARKTEPGVLALEFARIMSVRFPRAFELNPGLTRSIETRLTGVIRRSSPKEIEALERVIETEVAQAEARAALGEKSATPITYS